MRRALSLGLLAALSVVSQGSAQSGAVRQDFTGAYAGVNAGYGFERGRDAREPAALPDGAFAAPSNDLPPSASVAAKSLKAARPAMSR